MKPFKAQLKAVKPEHLRDAKAGPTVDCVVLDWKAMLAFHPAGTVREKSVLLVIPIDKNHVRCGRIEEVPLDAVKLSDGQLEELRDAYHRQ